MNKKKTLQKIIYSTFLKSSLVPILVIEVMLLLLYFGINNYISDKNLKTLLQDTKENLVEITGNQVRIIDEEFKKVMMIASVLQKEHEAFFRNPAGFGYPNGKPELKTAANGVLYKANKVGSSVYVSSKTRLTEENLAKFSQSEMMDISFKSIVDENENIVAAYFNSYDDFNRIYPFIDDVAEQYGEHIHMEDFNFYYLADKAHNPEKKPVWTGAYLDPAGNGWMTSCIVPVYRNDFLEGVTGLDITIDTLVNSILQLDLPWNASAFLVDENSQVMAMSQEIEQLVGLNVEKQGYGEQAITTTVDQADELNLLKNANVSPELKAFLKSEQRVSTISLDAKKFMITHMNIESTGWKLLIIVDEEILLKKIHDLKALSDKIGYFAIGLMLLFYVIFFYFLMARSKKLANTIASPILNLTEFLKNIGSSKDAPADSYSAGIAEIDFITTFTSEIQKVNREFFDTNQELREKTEKIRTILRISKIATLELEITGEAYRTSENLQSIFDLDEGSTINNSRLLEMVHPDDRERLSAVFTGKSAATMQTPYNHTVFRIITAKGVGKYVELYWGYERDASGSVSKLRGTLQDITDKALSEQMAEYLQFGEMKENLLRNLSHEIRTPLNGILGMSQLIVKRVQGDAKLEAYGKQLDSSVLRITHLTDRILKLANLQSGSYKTQQDGAVLREKLVEIIKERTNEARDKEIAFKVKITPELTNQMKCDTVLVETALNEVLDNAMKYTRGGGEVSVDIDLDGDTQQLSISVSDTGQGMDSDTVKNAQDMFYQGDMSASRANEGAGIGLSIVQEIAKQMQGDLQIESASGKGTTVRLILTLNTHFRKI